MGLFDQLFKDAVNVLSNGKINVITKEERLAIEQKAEEERRQMAAKKKAEEERRAAEKREEERRAAEKREEERRAAEKAFQEELDEMLKPSCEKGDCLMNRNRFYFTCDCDCERKRFNNGTMLDLKYWPYMKQFEVSERKFLENERKYSRKIEERITDNFINEFFGKNFDESKNNENILSLKQRFSETFRRIISREAFDCSNFLLAIVIEVASKLPLEDIVEKIEHLAAVYAYNFEGDEVFKFYTNPSLYKRSQDDFVYAVRLFEDVRNKEYLSSIYKDITLIKLEQFYDKDGNVKESGIGGPMFGFFGDTLYNLDELVWKGKNGENLINQNN